MPLPQVRSRPWSPSGQSPGHLVQCWGESRSERRNHTLRSPAASASRCQEMIKERGMAIRGGKPCQAFSERIVVVGRGSEQTRSVHVFRPVQCTSSFLYGNRKTFVIRQDIQNSFGGVPFVFWTLDPHKKDQRKILHGRAQLSSLDAVVGTAECGRGEISCADT